jgi:hypothetical protein
MRYIQITFGKVEELHIINLIGLLQRAALSNQRWLCSGRLRKLTLQHCELSLHSVSRLISAAPGIDELVIEECSPMDDPKHGAVLVLPNDRVFRRLQVPYGFIGSS